MRSDQEKFSGDGLEGDVGLMRTADLEKSGEKLKEEEIATTVSDSQGDASARTGVLRDGVAITSGGTARCTRACLPMAGPMPFGLTFSDKQCEQLIEDVGGTIRTVTPLVWIGGEIVQFKEGASHWVQRRHVGDALVVIVVELPDLFSATGTGWECGDHRLNVGGLGNRVIGLT